jgi:hypothetical protein
MGLVQRLEREFSLVVVRKGDELLSFHLSYRDHVGGSVADRQGLELTSQFQKPDLAFSQFYNREGMLHSINIVIFRVTGYVSIAPTNASRSSRSLSSPVALFATARVLQTNPTISKWHPRVPAVLNFDDVNQILRQESSPSLLAALRACL